MVSGHSILACDSDFGITEKVKWFYPNIYVPGDWIDAIRTGRIEAFPWREYDLRKFYFNQGVYEKMSHKQKDEHDEQHSRVALKHDVIIIRL